nr:MAG TPA: hypothetical protein [Caudoviricetes sp.]
MCLPRSHLRNFLSYFDYITHFVTCQDIFNTFFNFFVLTSYRIKYIIYTRGDKNDYRRKNKTTS